MDETHHMTTGGLLGAGATTAPVMTSIALIATAGSGNPPPRQRTEALFSNPTATKTDTEVSSPDYADEPRSEVRVEIRSHGPHTRPAGLTASLSSAHYQQGTDV
jgi:hypothetical protein